MKRAFKAGTFPSRSLLPQTLLLFSALILTAVAIVLWDGALNRAPAASPEPPRQPAERSSGAGGKSQELSVVAQLGRKMFFDPSLSPSQQLSCASCHSPANAYGSPNGLVVGHNLRNAGLRAVPSLTYVGRTPIFTIGPNSNKADNDRLPQARVPAPGVNKTASVAKADAAAAKAAYETAPRGGPDWAGGAMLLLAEADESVPRGGLDRDGRAKTIQSQALGALLDPNEMGNSSMGEVLDHIKHAPYAADMKDLFSPTLFEQPSLALDEALFAIARYQLEEPSFHSYDSKYDAFLAGKAKLSEAEARGLKLFEDPHKGNCSSCHIDKPSRDRLPPTFTDYQFEALGAPRNQDIPANSDPNYYDLGLCGPLRKDYADTAVYCGLFKTPSLRNVATRKVFFHNGVFHSLEEVMHFYVERETNPAKWYPRLANGQIDRYNDLPVRYKQNINAVDAPFNRKEGDEPALNDAEIADVIAFLKTLTDGYGAEPPDDSPTQSIK
jgi:cytochrome c peroxidase